MTNKKLKKNHTQRAMGALRRVTVGALLGSALLGGAAWAAPIPFQNRQVSLTPHEQPIASFLQDFFNSIDIPVQVSPSVQAQQGGINGTFQGTADQVFSQVARAYNLMAYYDGSVVWVYTMSEASTRLFQSLPQSVGSPATVISQVRDMQLPDAHNTLRATRNGGLIASGTPRFIAQVAQLIEPTTTPGSAPVPLGFKVYYLNYAWAQDVSVDDGNNQTTTVPGVATILRNLLTSQRSSSSALAQYRSTGEQSLRNQGLERQTQIQNGTFQNGTLGAQGANAMQPSAATVEQAWNNRPGGVQGDSLNAELQSLNAAGAMANDARVEADPRLNAVIVRDAPARLPYYDQLVKALDVEPMELEIEATIIDLSSTKMRQLGINWNLAGDRYSFLFGNGTSSDNSLTTPSALTTRTTVRDITSTASTTEGGILSLVLGGNVTNFAARINALQDEGVARIVTSPQVSTLSNVEAVIDNSQSFYVRVAGRQEVDLFKVSAGTTLRIMPHVFKEGSDVRIKLLVQIDDGSIDSTNEVDSIPEVDRSSINTQALLVAGESLLIGGTVTDTQSDDVTKVPLLGDIPVLGYLFKYKSNEHDRAERLYLISPRLVSTRPTITTPIPVGPQRPGRAVEPPPMPKFEPPIWEHGNETPKPSDKPVSNKPASGDMPPAGASISSNETPKPSDKPASNRPASGDMPPAGASISSNETPKPSDKSAASNMPASDDMPPAGAPISSNETPKPSDKPAFNMPASGG